MLVHPPQREGLRVLEKLYKKRANISALPWETQKTKALPKIEQGTRQETQGTRQTQIRRGYTIRDSMALQERTTR